MGSYYVIRYTEQKQHPRAKAPKEHFGGRLIRHDGEPEQVEAFAREYVAKMGRDDAGKPRVFKSVEKQEARA